MPFVAGSRNAHAPSECTIGKRQKSVYNAAFARSARQSGGFYVLTTSGDSESKAQSRYGYEHEGHLAHDARRTSTPSSGLTALENGLLDM
ncbi:hypothetical protein CVT26_004385 [Gymnopilus dilepis]|uniref:Uncharacterized protein n=1 Tax=Gymnopilus dilepis TaxID=231916 RepID=A0A409WDZ5_9AGAR|nr:hypothetical protein CVT26_004385 [Gymnopilus dilepis]